MSSNINLLKTTKLKRLQRARNFNMDKRKTSIRRKKSQMTNINEIVIMIILLIVRA